MTGLLTFWKFLKMIYQLFYLFVRLFTLLFNIFWFACNFASAIIPWLTLILVLVCVSSKFVKLRGHNEKLLLSLIGGDGGSAVDDLSYWPIANRGAGYDAPENSKAALNKCVTRGFRNVLLDASLTSCGEIVLVNSTTIDKAGLSGGTAKHSLAALREINIAELHPLGSQFKAEAVLTLSELLTELEDKQLTVFLHISDSGTRMLDAIKSCIRDHDIIARRTILVSRSPYAIYQLRKHHPELMCGLWSEKSMALSIMKVSTLITSIYGAILRNIIAPVIGIGVVFISKEEFNLHIADLWRNVGVRPIVYNVNSPNEKRYFQKTMKTQYLTDSLRSEPHLLMKA